MGRAVFLAVSLTVVAACGSFNASEDPVLPPDAGTSTSSTSSSGSPTPSSSSSSTSSSGTSIPDAGEPDSALARVPTLVQGPEVVLNNTPAGVHTLVLSKAVKAGNTVIVGVVGVSTTQTVVVGQINAKKIRGGATVGVAIFSAPINTESIQTVVLTTQGPATMVALEWSNLDPNGIPSSNSGSSQLATVEPVGATAGHLLFTIAGASNSVVSRVGGDGFTPILSGALTSVGYEAGYVIASAPKLYSASWTLNLANPWDAITVDFVAQ